MAPEMMIVLIVIGSIVFLLLVFAIWWISTLNMLRRLQVKVDEAESGIDVALTKRFDLLTKLVSTTKGYAKHEAETLTKVVSMRQPAKDAPMSEKQAFSDQVAQGLAAVNVVVERYPELKASEVFIKLQQATVEVEENLQASRRVYNSNVSIYNQKIVVWPNTIIARRLGLQKRDFFEAEAAKRADVAFDF